MKNNDVELLLDLSELDHSYMFGDVGRLKQILNNLVGNAIKFTHSGNIVIKANIENISSQRGNLVVSVEDSGIGIPEDKLADLFEAFTQADSSTTRQYGGTGLGLSIAKNLVEIMGGQLCVESTVDEGSTFSFSFEVNLSQNQPMTMPSTDIRGKKVLIVDDNEVNIKILQAQLNCWEVDVTAAMSAKEAIELCKKQDKENFFDIAILDMQMPEVDGDTLGEELSSMEQCADMKMIMMTSFGRHRNIEKLRKKGFHAFFMKPTTASDLYDALLVLVHDEVIYEVDTILTKDKLHSFLPQELENAKNVKILLVEDNITNQDVAQSMLNALDLKADIANHGGEAVEILKNSEQKYNIVLMDWQMPVLDGFETTAHIRDGRCGDRYMDVPIIAMTANAMEGDKQKCLDAGMNDYISKPIALKVLKEVVIKWIKEVVGDIALAPVEEKIPVVVNVENELVSWDEDELLERLGGSRDLVKKIMEVFLIDISTQTKKLGVSLDNENIKELHLQAHTVKGSAGNLSALKLQALAKSIEHAVKDDTFDATRLREKYTLLEEEVKNIIAIFEQYLQKVTIPLDTQNVISVEDLTSSLQDIKTELESGGFIDSSECAVFNVSFNESVNKKLKKLKKSIDSYINEEAFQTIDAIFVELGE